MPLSWFLWSNSLFTSDFLKKVLLARMGSTILKNDFEYFRSKISPFLTPKRLQNEQILSLLLALLALLLVRFAMCSLHVPFKNSLWLQPRAFFASEPRLQKRPSAKRLQFFQCRVRSAIFFLLFMLYNAFSIKFSSFFVKSAPRPRWEAHFWKTHVSKVAL